LAETALAETALAETALAETALAEAALAEAGSNRLTGCWTRAAERKRGRRDVQREP